MKKEEAKTILEKLLEVLHQKGGVQVTPNDYDRIKQAVETLK